MREHVAGVAAIVAAAPLPLTIELANENAHETQQADLQDVAFLLELRALVPAPIPVSLGSSCCGQSDTEEHYPGGDYSTPHLDRSRPIWQEVARIKHLIEDFRAFTVDDEPIGAAEADDERQAQRAPGTVLRAGRARQPRRRRRDVPLVGRADGRGAGIADGCVRGGVHRRRHVAPDGASFRFVNDSAADGITHGADWSHVFKLFGFINRDPSQPSYVVALGVTGDLGATYVNGWHAVRVVAERPGVQVIEVQR
jgi:hypothetical protein